MRREYGEQSTCHRCHQDIEWLGRANGWRDRGGNRSCGSYFKAGEVVKPPKRAKHRPVTRKEWL